MSLSCLKAVDVFGPSPVRVKLREQENKQLWLRIVIIQTRGRSSLFLFKMFKLTLFLFIILKLICSTKSQIKKIYQSFSSNSFSCYRISDSVRLARRWPGCLTPSLLGKCKKANLCDCSLEIKFYLIGVITYVFVTNFI